MVECVPAADPQRRSIIGCILPYDEEGSTTGGRLTFTHGSLRIPNDVSDVKLLRDHSTHGDGPVGVMTRWWVEDNLVCAEFVVPNTPDGDVVLAEAQTVRNRFSIEAVPLSMNGPYVHDAVLRKVALVPIPAYERARVMTIHAEHTEALILAEHTTAAAGGGDHHHHYYGPQATGPAPAQPSAPPAPAPGSPAPAQPAPAPAPAQPAPAPAQPAPQPAPAQPAPAPAQPAPAPAQPAPAAPQSGYPGQVVPAVVPQPQGQAVRTGGATTSERTGPTLRQVIDHIGSLHGGRARSEIHAELQDITIANQIGIAAPGWLGELWSGVAYQRRVIPLFTTAALTSREAVGYKWKTKPKVDAYAGNKADIPTNKPETEKVTMASKRWAGGHDIDRAFFDFGDTQYIAAYWAAMNESYAEETDLDFAQWIIGQAKPVDGTYPDLVRAVAAAAITIDTDVRQAATAVLVNPLDMLSLLDVSMLEAPHYGTIAPIADPSKWTMSTEVARGTAIVGSKNAATFYELAGSPLRAEAEHLAKGGRDAALFGYTAQLMNRADALRKVTFAAPAPAPAGS